MEVSIKRIYDEPRDSDGIRILVDRLWPRGISKERAKIDEWVKEIAPSEKLRKWFNHDLNKWSEFKKKYTEELKNKEAEKLLLKIEDRKATLLYGAKDSEHNDAIVLRDFLIKMEVKKNGKRT